MYYNLAYKYSIIVMIIIYYGKRERVSGNIYCALTVCLMHNTELPQ